MSENGEIYTAGKNFTLPPGLTGWTNSTSDPKEKKSDEKQNNTTLKVPKNQFMIKS